MNKKKKICVFTGARSEYGLLRPLIKKLVLDKEFDIKLVVSGMHLSPEFGLTYEEIQQDGFEISEKCEILLSSDTPVGVVKSIGIGLINFSEILQKYNPDLVILLGDRFESFSFAISSYYSKIPIAHIHGGEITEGSLDENIRHSITKLSHYHFTSTEEYRRNIIQLGENPDKIFCVGALGLDCINELKLYSKEELEKKLNKKLFKTNFLITFHPATSETDSIFKEVENLLNSLRYFKNSLFIFTESNSDSGGRLINKTIKEFCKNNSENTLIFSSMGQKLYFSLMSFADVIIGNSSSGIIEAPSFKIPTVNIGSRQKGRIKCASVIDCETEKESIIEAIKKALSKEFKETISNLKNPYGDGKASEKIIAALKSIDKFYYKKYFHTISF